MKDKIYKFGKSRVDGGSSMKDILGGKGAHLAEMCSIGISVPPGFTIPCKADKNYNLKSHIEFIENESGRKFFNLTKDDKPLIVSVRSGAPVSMPGVLDTVLNVGLNDQIIEQMRDQGFCPLTLYGAYRRLIYTFSSVVLEDGTDEMEMLWDEMNEDFEDSHHGDRVFRINDLCQICEEYKRIYKEQSGFDFPQSTTEQLHRAVEGVANSWNAPHAVRYREGKGCEDTGTAINVQQMVFGNMNEESGTGIAHLFTDGRSYGEFLVHAQGDDVVAGYKTPLGFSEDYKYMKKFFPNATKELKDIFDKLLEHYGHDLYIEFTIEDDKAYILQARKLVR